MQDLRFLSVEELERFLRHLQLENADLESQVFIHEVEMMHIKDNKLFIEAVESEILERTLLGASNNGD